MNLYRIFDIAGTGLSAQTLRLNTIASNLANAESVASSEEDAYRALNPVFEAVFQRQVSSLDAETALVRVREVVRSEAPVERRYEPGNPMADEEGYVYRSNVNIAEEMANMISASRSYQTNVEVMNMTRELLQATLRLGQ